MNQTSIQYLRDANGVCGLSWNPITGCSDELSCWSYCWARKMAQRLRGRCGYDAQEPFRPTFHPDRLDEPLRMKKPRRIAVSFMGDMFNAAVPFGWPTHVFDVAEQCPQHTFLVLTKRPGRMAEFLAGKPPSAWRYCSEKLPNNIWLGTSIANQSDADERIPHLLRCRAAIRYLSIEPMNGPIERLPLEGIHWVVLGGGPFRVHPRWVRNVRDLCQAAGVPFWMKNWGDFRPATEADRENTVCYQFASDGQPMVRVGKKFSGDVLDGRQWHELPGGET